MPSHADIRRQINALPDRYIFWTGKEIRGLPKILDNDEHILGLTSGYVDASTWLAVCTNRRIIFLNRRWFFGLRQVQMPLDRLQSIDHSFGLFFGTIRVFDGVNAFGMSMVAKYSILPFVKATEEAMYNVRHGQQRITDKQSNIASQLATLADLKEKGHLTEDEFQQQKKRLLG